MMPPADGDRGRVAIVTGGGRGIGRAVTLGLAGAGMRVAVVYRSDRAAAEATVAQVATTGGEAFVVAADVTVDDQVDGMVDGVLAHAGRIDVLVNNAGAATQAATHEVTRELWDGAIAGNLTSAFQCAARVLPTMRAQGYGRIVNVSSQAGLTGGVTGPHYAAAKGGLLALTKYLARAHASDGITVNAVAPNYTDTDLLAVLGIEARRDDITAKLPIGRFARPDEVAAAVVFLAGEASSYVNGECVGVTGGM
jgi:3-oxoacyl-[acyl-carrier protein] reductase